MYKKNLISDRNLYVQSELDDIAKNYLKEFYKNHNKISVNVLYAPYLKIGQTVSVTDDWNNVSAVSYFIEKIADKSGYYALTLARYP